VGGWVGGLVWTLKLMLKRPSVAGVGADLGKNPYIQSFKITLYAQEIGLHN